jgi:hypothetical protein
MNPTLNTPALEGGGEYKRNANGVKTPGPASLVQSWLAERRTIALDRHGMSSFRIFRFSTPCAKLTVKLNLALSGAVQTL